MTSKTGDGEFGFQIAPMLDVLFVLLLFFMVATGAQKHETNLVVPLPGPGEAPSGKVPITLAIDADGQVNFNGAETDSPVDHQLPQTMARLQAVLAQAPNRPVFIEPAPTTRQQRVMDVLNLCKAVNVRNLAFSSSRE